MVNVYDLAEGCLSVFDNYYNKLNQSFEFQDDNIVGYILHTLSSEDCVIDKFVNPIHNIPWITRILFH